MSQDTEPMDRALTGQIWDILSINIKNERNRS